MFNALDRFSGGRSDLATFFRSLASPPTSYSTSTALPGGDLSDWELFRAKAGPNAGNQIDFFGAGLHGEDGAQKVLAALERLPTTRSINLSNNRLGDSGLRVLLVGLKRLRHRCALCRRLARTATRTHADDVG